MVAIKDPAESKINLLEPKEGRAIPGEDELLIGYDAMNAPGYRVGDVLTIELSNGTQRQVPVVGIVADQSAEQDPEPTDGWAMWTTIRWNGWASTASTTGSW